MNRLVFINPGQQMASLALATLLTASMLLSLGAEADHRYVDARLVAQAVIAQQNRAAIVQPSRS